MAGHKTGKRRFPERDLTETGWILEPTDGWKNLGRIGFDRRHQLWNKKSLKNDVAGGTEDVCYKLYITAKAKGYVRFLLVSVLQKPTETYPCHLKDEINEEEYNNIKNSTDFIEKLGTALKSEKVTTLLKNLI